MEQLRQDVEALRRRRGRGTTQQQLADERQRLIAQAESLSGEKIMEIVVSTSPSLSLSLTSLSLLPLSILNSNPLQKKKKPHQRMHSWWAWCTTWPRRTAPRYAKCFCRCQGSLLRTLCPQMRSAQGSLGWEDDALGHVLMPLTSPRI